MTREIKFRAWDKDSSTMFYPQSSGYEEFYFDFLDGKMALMAHVEDNYPEKRDAVIMQYTGLHDKNGKEIYEGDILKYTRKHWYCPGHPKHNQDLVDQEEVYWDEERNAMSVRTFDFERLKQNPNQAPYSSSGYLGNGWNDERADKNIVEIIGNIYSDPHLLLENYY